MYIQVVEGHPRVESIDRRVSEFRQKQQKLLADEYMFIARDYTLNHLPISIVKIVRIRKMFSREFGSEEMLRRGKGQG